MLTSTFSLSVIGDYLAEFITSEFIYFIRVLLGGFLGFCIDMERRKRQKEAGIATHFIVAIAATLLTCISLWFQSHRTAPHAQRCHGRSASPLLLPHRGSTCSSGCGQSRRNQNNGLSA